MKFYTDVHISREVVKQLRQKGIDIIYCGEVGLSDATDPDHLKYATTEARIMVSCDDDFERPHMEWLEQGKPHAGIVYFRMMDQCQQIGLVCANLLSCTLPQITRRTYITKFGGCTHARCRCDPHYPY